MSVVSYCSFNCISLMINSMEHVFMCLSAIHISFLVRCLFKYFAYFLDCFLLLNFKSPLYILDRPFVRYVIKKGNLQIFCLSVHSLYSAFHGAKSFNFHEVLFINFSFIDHVYSVTCKDASYNTRS